MIASVRETRITVAGLFGLCGRNRSPGTEIIGSPR
jgi:hypothetical protein